MTVYSSNGDAGAYNGKAVFSRSALSHLALPLPLVLPLALERAIKHIGVVRAAAGLRFCDGVGVVLEVVFVLPKALHAEVAARLVRGLPARVVRAHLPHRRVLVDLRRRGETGDESSLALPPGARHEVPLRAAWPHLSA